MLSSIAVLATRIDKVIEKGVATECELSRLSSLNYCHDPKFSCTNLCDLLAEPDGALKSLRWKLPDIMDWETFRSVAVAISELQEIETMSDGKNKTGGDDGNRRISDDDEDDDDDDDDDEDEDEDKEDDEDDDGDGDNDENDDDDDDSDNRHQLYVVVFEDDQLTRLMNECILPAFSNILGTRGNFFGSNLIDWIGQHYRGYLKTGTQSALNGGPRKIPFNQFKYL